MASREVPSLHDLVDFSGAVAGHAGTLCDTDGYFFIKPCTQNEIDFYEAARAEHSDFADLMPLYIGSLMLNNATDITADIVTEIPTILDPRNAQAEQVLAGLQQLHKAPDAGTQASTTAASTPAADDSETWVPRGSQSIHTNRAVVLENATYGYQKANVLDVKLGQRLWADDAPRQKRVRMDEVRAATTHDKLGFRISGMRVFQGSSSASDVTDAADATPTGGFGYKQYDKDFGRYEVNSSNVVDAFRSFVFNEAAGIDEDLGRAVATVFKQDLERVRDVMEKERTRMYSASLLFVFEGDGAALREAIAANEEAAAKQERPTATKPSGLGDRSTLRTDSGIVMEEDIEIHMESNIFMDDGFVDVDDEDDDDDDELELPPVCGLRLIDFAHARFCPGEEEPDENVLVGVRSLIRIFDELAR